MSRATRPRPRTPRWPAVPPRGLRPRLDASQRLDLGLCHISNLDAIARGTATEAMLWDWVAAVLTWSRAAELMQAGVPEMESQLGLTTRLIERYGRTGAVRFDGADYQLAKVGLDVMDQLASLVDRRTAIAAAEWSEARVNRMAAECRPGERQAA